MTEADTIAADPKFETRRQLTEWIADGMNAFAQFRQPAAILYAQRIVRVTLAHKDLNDGQD